MKKQYFVVLTSALVLLWGCAKVPNELLIDSFEGELNNETVDFGSSADSLITVAAEKGLKVCGEQALKLTYELDPKGYMWCARGYNLDVKGAARWLVKPKNIRWQSYQALSIAMYGTSSGRQYALDVKDAGGEMWRTMLTDNFNGWKEVICPFSQFFARSDWQPQTADKNEALNFPLQSFQFEPRTPGKGSCYFDCVKAVKITPPNPD